MLKEYHCQSSPSSSPPLLLKKLECMYISRSGNRQVHFKLRRTCALRDRCQQARCWLMSLSSFPPHRPRCPFALPHPRTVWLAHQEPVHSPQALYQPTPHCWFSCQVLYAMPRVDPIASRLQVKSSVNIPSASPSCSPFPNTFLLAGSTNPLADTCFGFKLSQDSRFYSKLPFNIPQSPPISSSFLQGCASPLIRCSINIKISTIAARLTCFRDPLITVSSSGELAVV